MKIVVLGLVLVVSSGLAVSAQGQKSYAERLGWNAGDRVVIFHCDDAGMSHSSNVGAIEALEAGVVTSVSTMMPCGWVPEFAAYLKEHPEVDNGCHLTLTAEWKKYRWSPLAGRDVVPGLVDEEGCLWHGVPQVVLHASPDEVEKEIRAQVARAEAMGIPITHIDTHMGTLFGSPEFFERWVKVAVEKQLPILMAGGHLTYASKRNTQAIEWLRASGAPEKVWAAGLPVIDDIAGGIDDSASAEEKVANAIVMLRGLKPGITQIIVHCTRPTDEFAHITSSGPARLAELKTMLDPRVKQCIEDEGIIRTTWRELKQRRDKAGAGE